MRRGGVPGFRRRMGRPVQHVLRLPSDIGGFGFGGSSSSGSTRPTRNATSGGDTDASLHDDPSRPSTSSTRSPRPPPPPTAQASASRPTAEHVTGGVRECFDAGRWQLAHECPGHLAAGHERFERDGREVLTTFDPSSRYADWRRRHARAPRRRPRSCACPGAAAPSFDRGLRLGLGRSSATDRTPPMLRGRPSWGEGGAGGLAVLAASAPFMAMGGCRPVAGSANGTTGRSSADRASASPRPASPCGMRSGPAVPVGKGSTTGGAAGAPSETGARQDGRGRTVAVVEGEALRAIEVSPSPPTPGAVPADSSDVRLPACPPAGVPAPGGRSGPIRRMRREPSRVSLPSAAAIADRACPADAENGTLPDRIASAERRERGQARRENRQSRPKRDILAGETARFTPGTLDGRPNRCGPTGPPAAAAPPPPAVPGVVPSGCRSPRATRAGERRPIGSEPASLWPLGGRRPRGRPVPRGRPQPSA